MTEIHAFDPDGTPSPGAQIALNTATEGLATETYVDGAVTGIPVATAEAAGLMGADDKAAMGDASALTRGTVPAARLPAATDADAGVVSLDEVSTRAATITQSAMADAVTTDELFQMVMLDTVQGITELGSSIALTVLIAPYPMRITRFVASFDRLTMAASSTNFVKLTFRRISDGDVSDIVSRSSADGAIAPRTPWLFDAAAWNEDARELDTGDSVVVAFSSGGTGKFILPATLQIGYEPR